MSVPENRSAPPPCHLQNCHTIAPRAFPRPVWRGPPLTPSLRTTLHGQPPSQGSRRGVASWSRLSSHSLCGPISPAAGCAKPPGQLVITPSAVSAEQRIGTYVLSYAASNHFAAVSQALLRMKHPTPPLYAKEGGERVFRRHSPPLPPGCCTCTERRRK